MTILGLIICSVTLTKRNIYFKTSLNTVRQSLVTHVGDGKPILACSCFSPSNWVTSDCLTVLKLVQYIYLLVCVTEQIIHKGSEVPWVGFWVLKNTLRKKTSSKKHSTNQIHFFEPSNNCSIIWLSFFELSNKPSKSFPPN